MGARKQRKRRSWAASGGGMSAWTSARPPCSWRSRPRRWAPGTAPRWA